MTLIYFLLLCFYSLTLPVNSMPRDSDILIRVKNYQISDPNNSLENWIIHSGEYYTSPCNWTAIVCNPNSNSSVISINIQGLGLSGGFPAGFCRIPTLRNLSIADNNFSGNLSSEFFNLCSQLHSLNVSNNNFSGYLPDFSPEFTTLYSLDLANNEFSGGIPRSFGKLPALMVLRLYNNLLTGPSIPEFLSNLSWLTHLELAYNPFDSSEIPPAIGNLSKLEILWLTRANLIGKIPESICGLQSLRNLDVATNSLSGEIPRCIGNLRSLVQLELYDNRFFGKLPESLGNLRSLLFFDASQNNLTGILPENLAALPLVSLNLNDNRLQGKIPDILAQNKNLNQLKLFNNSFSGELPPDLGLNSNLVEFDVSTNNFSGRFPAHLCFKKNLRQIIAFDNNFSGNFPDSYGNCRLLGYVRIHNNNFSGEFPRSFWSLPELYFAELINNRFEGVLPPTISIASKLTNLKLSGNIFSGNLPSNLCELKRLVVLDLSKNHFSGQLPKCLTELRSLQKIELQENMFSGEFPSNVSSWIQLTELNLSINQFSGEIPSQLGDLLVLNYLDLSKNSFSGKIPAELTKLKLNKFNISNNKLEGQVPWGFNSDIYLYSLLGNPKLCSPNLNPLPHCPKPRPVSLCLITFLSILSFVLLSSLLWLCKTKLQTNTSTKSNKNHAYKITTYQRVGFNEHEIVLHLTDENLIGSGGSGLVYRVILKSGQAVAVKKLWCGHKNRYTDLVFKSEVEILGRVRHGNIIRLLFSCVGEDFRVLGYEHMTNGSLADVLHREKGGVLLDWPRRFSIALGVAQGLAYLHHDCVPAIVHRDVKSNNILLDDEFLPRIADFGLARQLVRQSGPQEMESVGVMSHVAGSYGYIAPEYAYSLRVTEKSDVYSYGVVLIELITGKQPNEPSIGENKDIVNLMKEIVLIKFLDPDQINQVLDPRINLATCNYNEITKLIEVAILCTSIFPMNRPSMRRVVELLKDQTKATARPKSSS